MVGNGAAVQELLQVEGAGDLRERAVRCDAMVLLVTAAAMGHTAQAAAGLEKLVPGAAAAHHQKMVAAFEAEPVTQERVVAADSS